MPYCIQKQTRPVCNSDNRLLSGTVDGGAGD